MVVSTPAELDRTKIKALIEREEQALNEEIRIPSSKKKYYN